MYSLAALTPSGYSHGSAIAAPAPRKIVLLEIRLEGLRVARRGGGVPRRAFLRRRGHAILVNGP
jgi:hypothetical protein